jgi:hypothetical protein
MINAQSIMYSCTLRVIAKIAQRLKVFSRVSFNYYLCIIAIGRLITITRGAVFIKNEIFTINIFSSFVMFLNSGNWTGCVNQMNLNKLIPREIYGRIYEYREPRQVDMWNLQKDICHKTSFNCPRESDP